MSSNKIVINNFLDYEVSDICVDQIIALCKRYDLKKKRYVEITGCGMCHHINFNPNDDYTCNITKSRVVFDSNRFHINCPLKQVEE